MNISFLVTGYQQDGSTRYTVGKELILKRICETLEKDKYLLKFPNFELTFTDLSCRIDAERFYNIYCNDFHQNAIIIIVYSRKYNDSYKFAKELYNIIKNESDHIYLIETDQDCQDKLKRDVDFDQSIEEKLFKCDFEKNSKDDLLNIFLYISLIYQNTNSPTFNVCFPKHDVQNLIATSEKNKRTFVLTYKSIKMNLSDSDSNIFINFQFSTDFTFYHPISLITNYDGTKLILVTAYQLYLIDKHNSHFDPDAYFLPDIHRITPVIIYHKKMAGQQDINKTKGGQENISQQVIDVQFLPYCSDCFAIVFPQGVQIYKITNDDRIVQFITEAFNSFNTPDYNFKICRFPRYDDLIVADLFKFYFLNSKNSILSVALDLTRNKNQDDFSMSSVKIDTIQVYCDESNNPYILFKLKNGQQKRLNFIYSIHNNNLKTTPLRTALRNQINLNNSNKPNENSNIIIHGFHFIKNEIVIYGSLMNKQIFFHASFKEDQALLDFVSDKTFDKIESINNVTGLFKIRDNLFAKAKDALYIFGYDGKELFIHKTIESKGIVGFSNAPFSCIIAPGYIVNLSYFFTRVNPINTYNYTYCRDVDRELEYFKMAKQKTLEKFQKESKDIFDKSVKFTNTTKKIYEKQQTLMNRAKQIGSNLDNLEQQARELLRQIYELQPVQQKVRVSIELKNPYNFFLVIGILDCYNDFLVLDEFVKSKSIENYGIAFCQPNSIITKGNYDKFIESAKENAEIINCINVFIISSFIDFDIEPIKKESPKNEEGPSVKADIFIATKKSVQVSIFVYQQGLRFINEITEKNDE